jgi:hypothetical protein
MSNFYSQKQQQVTNYGHFSDQLKLQLPEIMQQNGAQTKVSHLNEKPRVHRNTNRQGNNTEIRVSNFNQTVGSGSFNQIVKGLVQNQ